MLLACYIPFSVVTVTQSLLPSHTHVVFLDGGGTTVSSPTAMYDTRNSPFLELRTPFTAYEAFKMLLLLVLVPLRLVVCVLAVSVIAIINTIAAWNSSLDKPLPKSRRSWVLLSKEIFVVVLWSLGFVRLRVKGRENVAKAEKLGSVIVFNHVSYVDAPLFMWLFAPSGRPSCLRWSLHAHTHAAEGGRVDLGSADVKVTGTPVACAIMPTTCPKVLGNPRLPTCRSSSTW